MLTSPALGTERMKKCEVETNKKWPCRKKFSESFHANGMGNNEFSWSGLMQCLSMSSPIPTAKWGFDKMGRPGPNAYVKGQKHNIIITEFLYMVTHEGRPAWGWLLIGAHPLVSCDGNKFTVN